MYRQISKNSLSQITAQSRVVLPLLLGFKSDIKQTNKEERLMMMSVWIYDLHYKITQVSKTTKQVL
jgi:hypothetical protein